MNNNELFTRLNNVFRDVFDNESISVNEQTSQDDIDEWDSLAQISLIAAVENEFGIRFDIKNALKMKTAGQIAEAILALQ